MKNKELTEMGFDAAKGKLFDVLEEKYPELYSELVEVIEKEKNELGGDGG